MRRLPSLFVLAMIAGPVVPALASAQPSPSRFASAYLPAGHWSIDAVRRLDAFGLVRSGFDRGAQTLPRRVVAAALEEANRIAAEEAPAFLPLVRAYLERFSEEYPETVAGVRGGVARGLRPSDGAALAAYERHRGRMAPGVGYENDVDWSGPISVDDVSGAAAGAEWSAVFFPHVAVIMNPIRRGDDWRLEGVYVAGVWRALGGWIGRRQIGYGRARGGGIVLNAVTGLDGGGIHLQEPVRLPAFLDALGPVTFEAVLARGEENGPVEEPWVLVTRATIEPHPRIAVGLSRAAMFGGEDENGINLRNLAYLMIGKHAGAGSGFDNQVVALDVWYRPPVGALPLALYFEWGIEDSAGAFVDTPGLLVGIEIAAVPGLPMLSLALERASFARSCCGNPIWYRHWRFHDGWSHGGVPLGHRLGGHGFEWLLAARADLMEARLRLDARGFTRNRGAENLFAPDRAGESTGGSLALAYRMRQRLEALIDLAEESGDGWSESSARMGVRVVF